MRVLPSRPSMLLFGSVRKITLDDVLCVRVSKRGGVFFLLSHSRVAVKLCRLSGVPGAERDDGESLPKGALRELWALQVRAALSRAPLGRRHALSSAREKEKGKKDGEEREHGAVHVRSLRSGTGRRAARIAVRGALPARHVARHRAALLSVRPSLRRGRVHALRRPAREEVRGPFSRFVRPAHRLPEGERLDPTVVKVRASARALSRKRGAVRSSLSLSLSRRESRASLSLSLA